MEIGWASTASDVSVRVIHHYKNIGLVPKAAGRDWGYRDYDDKNVCTMRFLLPRPTSASRSRRSARC